MLVQERAFDPARTFFPKQGASTLLAIGSQVMPKEFCKAIEAALWEKLAALRSEGYRVIEGESVGKQALKRLQFDGSHWVLEDR